MDININSSRRQLLAGAGLTGLALGFPGMAFAKSETRVPSSVDLSSGNPAEFDYYLAPDAGDGRDSAEFWAWCHCGSVAINSLGVDQTGPGKLDLSRLTVTFPGGRILRDFVAAQPLARQTQDEIRTVIGTASARLETRGAFRQYRTVFKGTAIDTSYTAILEGRAETRRVNIEIEVDYDSIVPVLRQGSMRTGTEQAGADLAFSRFSGGNRTEQLLRTSGRVVADGIETTFTGGGVRVHRQDLRALTAGAYVWQAACFPSGRAFSSITYAGRDAAAPAYSEGAVFMGRNALIPARATQIPWIREWAFNREDVSLALAVGNETHAIKGTLVMSAPTLAISGAPSAVPARHQAIVRYEWDGEVTYGLIDRAFPFA